MHQTNVGRHPLRQTTGNATASARSAISSASQSASVPARKLLNLTGVGAKFAVSERTAHTLTTEDWFPPAIVLGPRIRRWDEAEIDAAVAARAPRRDELVEPEQLLRGKVARLKGVPACRAT